MLLPGWVLFVVSAGLGFLGLWLAYKGKWAVIVSTVATIVLVTVTILKLRDPLSLAPEYRVATQTWDYYVVLFWSCVIGLTLPIIGLYLRSRVRKAGTAGD